MRKPFLWMLLLLFMLGFSSLACQLTSGSGEPTALPAGEPADIAQDVQENVAEDTTEESLSEEPEAAAAGESSQAEPTQETSTEPGDTSGEAETTAPEVAEAESATPEEGAESIAEEDLGKILSEFDFATIAQELDINSYRFTLLMNFEGVDPEGNKISQQVNGEIAYVADPLAMSMVWDIKGVDEAAGFNQMTMAQVGDTTYMVLPELGCVTNNAPDSNLFDENPFVDFLNPSEFLDDGKGLERVGEEVVNDVPTIVYAFDKPYLEEENLERAEGRIYIAKEGRYIVRMVIDGEGAMDVTDETAANVGTFHFEFNFTDVNQPIEIGMPEECASAGAEDTALPMLDDAFEVTSFPGVISYKSNASVEEAKDFYEAALTADGWIRNEDESLEMTGTAILAYEKEGESLSLTIGEEAENDSIYVLIISGEGG